MWYFILFELPNITFFKFPYRMKRKHFRYNREKIFGRISQNVSTGQFNQGSSILTFIVCITMYIPFLWHYDASTENTHVLGSPNDCDNTTSRRNVPKKTVM